jgi:hypothetical protein
MKAMIPGRSFETRNHLPAAAPRAAIQAELREAAIQEAAIREEVIPAEVIPGEVIPAEVIPAEVIRGAATRAEPVAEGTPRADNKTAARTSKTTKKCSR